jgi:type VI secretion system protein ImpL
MTRKLKAGLGGTTVLTAAGTGAWHLGSYLGLHGRDLWILRGGLFLLACIAIAFAVWLYLRPRAALPPNPVADEAREIDAAVAAAGKRLAGARAGKRVSALPVVLLVGPGGSAKTTMVTRSGLNPDLLAGEIFRGDAVVSTRAVNLWYSGRTVFAEAGGKVTADAARWARLIRHLRPGRFRAALAGRSQPSRTAVVCLSCEDLLRGDAEGVAAVARGLRDRLAELALELGVRLPVYAVFTKADRLPHFQEYVRNFTPEEVREIFGTTFPLDLGTTDYAERSFKRIDRAFQRIFYSIASKRLKYLPRENDPESLAGAYEFPREFRKVTPLAAQFLVELCRPSQLALSPVLRGFYFVGVRPVILTDTPLERASTVESPAGESFPIGATSVFNPGQGPRAALARIAEPVPSTRKVPQWLFLERLFPDLLLQDRMAQALTQAGRRVDLLRRLLLGGAAAALAVVALGLSAAYLGNRELQDDVRGALGQMGSLPEAEDGLAARESLRRLDHLREQVARLSRYEREGPPWRLRWGLYSGAALYPEARRQYYVGLDRLLLADTRDSLILGLRRLPPTPTGTSDYGEAYATLKAYLITVSNPEKSTVEFLSPTLLARWHGSTVVDTSRTELARRQFDFYAQELPRGNPYAVEVESRTVNHARSYLRQFTGMEPIYRSMLASVSKAGQPIELARNVPNSAGVIRDAYVVPSQFTRSGWAAMQAAFADVDRFFRGESWVIGDLAPVTADRDKVRDQLRVRYVDEYVAHWRRFLGGAAVERFGGVQDGSRRLAALSSNQSPLLALFALISRNTAVDTVAVGPAFQPVQVVSPPGDTGKFVGPANEGYVNALVSLQASMDQIATGPPENAEAAVTQALADASQAKLATKQLANKFRIDTSGSVHLMVQRLMEAPILNVESALQAVGPAKLNGKGRAFCAPFQALLTKLPFNSYGTASAEVDEVNALLQPGTGMLWSFVEADLGNYVVRQGTTFAEKPGSPVRISPAFLAFLGRAADFSSALYRGEGSAPTLALTVRPLLSDAVPGLTMTVDGRPARFTRTSAAAKRIDWSAEEAREASLSALISGRDREVLTYRGTWAIFRLFQQADWTPTEGGYSVAWRLPPQGGNAPQRAVFDVHLAGVKPILRRDFFAGVSCTGRITR